MYDARAFEHYFRSRQELSRLFRGEAVIVARDRLVLREIESAMTRNTVIGLVGVALAAVGVLGIAAAAVRSRLLRNCTIIVTVVSLSPGCRFHAELPPKGRYPSGDETTSGVGIDSRVGIQSRVRPGLWIRPLPFGESFRAIVGLGSSDELSENPPRYALETPEQSADWLTRFCRHFTVYDEFNAPAELTNWYWLTACE